MDFEEEYAAWSEDHEHKAIDGNNFKGAFIAGVRAANRDHASREPELPCTNDPVHFDLKSEKHLDEVLAFLEMFSWHTKIEAYRIDGTSLIFYWHCRDEEHVYPLPSPMVPSQLGGTISSWLAAVEYPEAPDNDGSVKKGFRIHNHLCYSYSAFRVEADWVIYGK